MISRMSDSSQEDILRRLDELTRHMKRLEERLDVAERARVDLPRSQPPSNPGSAVVHSEPPPPAHQGPTPPTAAPKPIPAWLSEISKAPPAPPQSPKQPQRDDAPAWSAPFASRSVSAQAPPVARFTQLDGPKPKPARPRFWERLNTEQAWEYFIGGKAMAWLGALVVIGAVGFLVAMAYNEGWFGRLAPSLRCWFAAAFGLALLGAGEYAYRRVGRAASVGLVAAGLGTWYLTAYAAYGPLDLLGPTYGFLLMAGITGVGLAFTVRARMLAIGVISILAGYLVPIVFARDSTDSLALPVYISALVAVALGLSAWDPKVFRPLRSVALVCHALMGGVWVMGTGQPTVVTLVFMTAWWSATTFELIVAAARGTSPVANAVTSVLAGLWYVVLVQRTTATFIWLGGVQVDAAFTISIATLAGALALQFGTGLEGLKRVPVTALDRLTTALWLQCLALTAAGIALQFDAVGRSIGWMAMGLVCIEMGRRLPSRGLDRVGLLAGTAALADIAWRSAQGAFGAGWLGGVWWTGYGVEVTQWSALMAGMIAGVVLGARRLRTGEHSWKVMPVGLMLLAIALAGLVIERQTSASAATPGWLVVAVLLIATDRGSRRLFHAELGLLVVGLTLARWGFHEVPSARGSDAEWHAAKVLLNSQTIHAVLIVAAGALGLRRLLTTSGEGNSTTRIASTEAQWTSAVGAVVILVALSLDVDRWAGSEATSALSLKWGVGVVRILGWAVLWSIGGFLLGAVGSARRWQVIRAAGTWFILGSALVWAGGGVLIPRSARLVSEALLVINPQSIAGLLVAISAGILGLLLLRLRGWERDPDDRALFIGLLMAAAGFIVWLIGLIEIDRFMGQDAAQGLVALWGDATARVLGWIIWWAVSGSALLLFGVLRRTPALLPTGLVLLAAAVVAWLTAGTLIPRTYGAAQTRVLLNLQSLAALFGLTGLLLQIFFAQRLRLVLADASPRIRELANRSSSSAWAGITLVLLWTGSLEIDRFCAVRHASLADAAMVRQTSLSIYWALFGIALVAVGFARRVPLGRYAGLSLLTLTMLKVIIVDTSELAQLYRVFSWMGLGLLMVATSVAYVKFAPRMLGGAKANDESAPPGAVPHSADLGD